VLVGGTARGYAATTLSNPRAFPPPHSLDLRASRTVLGETYWATRKEVPVPPRHRVAPNVLGAVSALGVPFIARGLVVRDGWMVLFGLAANVTPSPTRSARPSGDWSRCGRILPRTAAWLRPRARVNLHALAADAGDVSSKDEKARRKPLKVTYLRAEQAASAALMPLDRPQWESLLDQVSSAATGRPAIAL
jgi:hypothetical protein